ncbi:lysophospholipid acyltransferase family protein [Mycoplasma bradburyae]|uniref:1-acyl-sn-glycerol-3-phosphate acyltransferase n=1 Tax=Mycoplasma bradburyae TaxID=2963128 RepID=A0AAW6HPY0_9MOLU|nr:lysophospholipid acyltransferase family protein [Mycoplasma bradburyae]MDC4163394.1 1-acyl-sn-glycerol-3-phosphate acyltransferase [Mycoplasma bradburyae]MDC4182010.1 1-acyl-sn-glycerol-3-phosphate acyltransferase [Mycoplasma bradburyae]MDC4183384.1 1-acyl-sn-glycerol-3-phosphate acyltransferase [Mycoplasma bradburyae]MDC4184191.1 1-acyl-sn-glycerol-3-phosphate acyltransferase [Mycoplasma bradburyae]UTS70435.1 1-acyl-sn-glycerol-3-phosphate acyltransferase [Mycoplasma bradburyae]
MRFIIRLLSFLIFPFVGLEFAIRYLVALIKASIYKNNPTFYTKENRFKTVYILASRIIFFKGLKIELKNEDLIPNKPVLFIGNHKSNIDPFVMIWMANHLKDITELTFVAKAELKKKSIGKIMSLIDVIFIDRQSIRQAAKATLDEIELLKNTSVCVFAEGTRVFSHELAEFKAGSIKAAYKAFCPIVPFSLFNTQGRMEKISNKKRPVQEGFRKAKTKKIYIEFLKPLKPIDYSRSESTYIINSIRKQIQETYNKQLADFVKK